MMGWGKRGKMMISKTKSNQSCWEDLVCLDVVQGHLGIYKCGRILE